MRRRRSLTPSFPPTPPPRTAQHFSDIGQAKDSKLVRKLLKVEQITGVFLGRDFISVNKKEETPWAVSVCRYVRAEGAR